MQTAKLGNSIPEVNFIQWEINLHSSWDSEWIGPQSCGSYTANTYVCESGRYSKLIKNHQVMGKFDSDSKW